MADYESIIESIIAARKPVVWTMHDHWLMTGRCAQPGSCERWKVGCGACPDLQAYPPTVLDFSEKEHDKKRDLLRRLSESTPTIYVSCAKWLAEEMIASGFGKVVTITNSVDYSFWHRVQSKIKPKAGPLRLIFICRDLRDRSKVRWDVLNYVAAIPNVELTIVGDNSPQTLAGVRHIDAIDDRVLLAEEMARHDDLLFTSEVDYFPLTVIEALAAGLGVIGLESKALRELSVHDQVRIFTSLDQLQKITESGPQAAASNVEMFSPDRMVADYSALYDSMLRVV